MIINIAPVAMRALDGGSISNGIISIFFLIFNFLILLGMKFLILLGMKF